MNQEKVVHERTKGRDSGDASSGHVTYINMIAKLHIKLTKLTKKI